MNRILLFLLLLSLNTFCFAQNFKYISVEDGLSNREVYSIQKDNQGYMWFLTHDGIDRFDGKHFKHYKLSINNKEISSFVNLNKLYKDTDGGIWEIGRNGQIFKYNAHLDKFQFMGLSADLHEKPEQTFNHAHIDENNNIWLCSTQKLFIFNINSSKFQRIKINQDISINNIAQIDSSSYYLGTPNGIRTAKLSNDSLQILPQGSIDSLNIQINTLYYNKVHKQLIIGSFLKGIYALDTQSKQFRHIKTGLEDVNINCIRALNDTEVLIGTDGAGIYKLNLSDYTSQPYIVADYNEPNGMDGNNINDIFVGEEERIWIANYPIGITMFSNRFPSYKWIKHSIGNVNSLINDQVNAVIEDSDGDIWYATNNGISLYHVKTGKWTNRLSSFHSDAHNMNHIFISLCEIMPGVIMVGGFTSGMYWIDKKDMKPRYFTPGSLTLSKHVKPDKYIRAIFRDSKEYVWAGGYYNLKRIDLKNRTIETYPGVNSINVILEKDSTHMWIGSSNGLYLLNTNTKNLTPIKLPVESNYINVLYQEENGHLYIGTSGSGMVIYNPAKKKFINYHKDNCALISNSIYSILPDGKGDLILSTENSLSRFNIKNKTFRNWTKEQGLLTEHFNPMSGTITRNNTFILGSGNGAVEFDKETHLPATYKNQLRLSDFHIFYQEIHPGETNSPLIRDINDINSVKLNYNQNTFSLLLSSINFDYPSNILYSWKLDGFYNQWSKPGTETLIRYTNLNPGKYNLRIRTLSKEDKHIYEERNIYITIRPPFWNTIWAQIIYLIVLVLLGITALRIYGIRKTQKLSTEKIQFFINTAHDIRTPLTMIKAPLDEMMENESLSQKGEHNLRIAIKNANSLFRMISNLINFEKADFHPNELNIAEYELYTFMEEIIKQFITYSEQRRVQLTFESNFRFLNVWFDRNKMESIIKNLISNAIKYTPENGSVRVIATSNSDNWSVEVQDTGIGIPANEKKQLFKLFFRGSNAINSKVTGSGVGLLLVRKLVQGHKGTISVKSVLNEGSSFKVTFRHGKKHFKNVHFVMPEPLTVTASDTNPRLPNVSTTTKANPANARILIVEDNDDLRAYLQQSFSEKYAVYVASNGQEALEKVKLIAPQLIISDIMMPVMRGDELCVKLKSNMETSHIPIILLTALNDKTNIINGLSARADRYMTKPFDIGILHATVINLLENRALLTRKFAQLDFQETECSNCVSELDFKFMTKIKEAVQKNMDNQSFKIEDLCSSLNMSRTSIYKKLTILTGQSPSDFIRLQRMNKAAQLLKDEKYTIAEIADMTGYNDAKYFREVFKKHFNMTPTQYINHSQQ